jgi:hypothetical protein
LSMKCIRISCNGGYQMRTVVSTRLRDQGARDTYRLTDLISTDCAASVAFVDDNKKGIEQNWGHALIDTSRNAVIKRPRDNKRA